MLIHHYSNENQARGYIINSLEPVVSASLEYIMHPLGTCRGCISCEFLECCCWPSGAALKNRNQGRAPK